MTPAPTVRMVHDSSQAVRSVQLLRFTLTEAHIWWPTAGDYWIDLGTCRMHDFDSDEQTPWKIHQSDQQRLRHRRPIRLYLGGELGLNGDADRRLRDDDERTANRRSREGAQADHCAAGAARR